ncbi:MAG: choice-of-anchor D domain-containing protein, partial [Burkholderia sp.]|nr:choice-of-anchor D domain-containing protein [Burkholderia sp.]
GIAIPAFTQVRIDAGTPVARDNYQVRTVAHADGHVYAAFYRRKGNVAGGYNADVVVVRDDDWGKTLPPFRSLVDTVTLVAGQNVVAATRVSDTLGSSVALGREWWGGDLYLTVDPNNSARVYISYSDSRTGAERTLHLRRSTDFGQTWSADLLTTPSAKNAAIAINRLGTIGYLYQRLAGTSPNLRWQTHLRRSADGGTTWDDATLADFPAEGPSAPSGARIVGDYLNMVAVGTSFYGVFSSYNDPVNASFPVGVTWLRNRTPDGDPMPRLLGVDGVTTVAPSIDPFFFIAKGPQPQIQVPGALDLGKTCVGVKGVGTLDVCNTGNDDLIVDAITSSNPRFSVAAPSAGFPVMISHDFCFPFQVVFNSAATGSQSATLTISSNDPDHPKVDVQVSGNGTEPDVRVTGSTDFGVASAWTPAEKTVSVCNTGGCNLSVTAATINCTDFTLVND